MELLNKPLKEPLYELCIKGEQGQIPSIKITSEDYETTLDQLGEKLNLNNIKEIVYNLYDILKDKQNIKLLTSMYCLRSLKQYNDILLEFKAYMNKEERLLAIYNSISEDTLLSLLLIIANGFPIFDSDDIFSYLRAKYQIVTKKTTEITDLNLFSVPTSMGLNKLLKTNKFIDKTLWEDYIVKENVVRYVSNCTEGYWGEIKPVGNFLYSPKFSDNLLSPKIDYISIVSNNANEYMYIAELHNLVSLEHTFIDMLFRCSSNYYIGQCKRCHKLFVSLDKQHSYCNRLNREGLTCSKQSLEEKKSRQSLTPLQKIKKDITNKHQRDWEYDKFAKFMLDRDKKEKELEEGIINEEQYFDWLNSFYFKKETREKHKKEYLKYKQLSENEKM